MWAAETPVLSLDLAFASISLSSVFTNVAQIFSFSLLDFVFFFSSLNELGQKAETAVHFLSGDHTGAAFNSFNDLS